jgi:hypothetical protein
MFFDFESSQDTGTHIVNYCVLKDFSGEINMTFPDCKSFCEFVFQKKNKGFTFIAHYMKGYDGKFVRKYCIDNALCPEVVMCGSKIMMMTIKKLRIRFIDSINFIGFPLADFPKIFSLNESKKGVFPHYFNKPCNQGGPIRIIK